jgi:hypothetical protein
LERDPGKYGVEILTPYPDKNIKQYWRPESNWPAVK